MPSDQAVEFQRRYFRARAHDEVLGAPDQFDGTVRTHAREIAGAEIITAEGSARQFWRVEIAVHDERRANLQFAGLARAYVIAFGIGDAKPFAFRNPTDPAVERLIARG